MSDELRYKPVVHSNGDFDWSDVMDDRASTHTQPATPAQRRYINKDIGERQTNEFFKGVSR